MSNAVDGVEVYNLKEPFEKLMTRLSEMDRGQRYDSRVSFPLHALISQIERTILLVELGAHLRRLDDLRDRTIETESLVRELRERIP